MMLKKLATVARTAGNRLYSTRKLPSQLATTGPRLEGDVAIVTGGGSGIGRATAELFANHGAHVVVADINEKGGQETVDRVNANGFGSAVFSKVDVTKADDNQSMVACAMDNFGKLDILFNNAGISHADDDNAEVTTEDIFELTMKVNVTGVFLGCKYGIPAMKASGGGSIINTASFVACLGAATPQIAYTASKGAVLAMTRELAVIHAKEHIRVNALCPGPLNTELLQKYLSDADKRNRRLVHIPVGRFGETEEIANGALFLASHESSFVTGSTFLVDGGITAAYVTPE